MNYFRKFLFICLFLQAVVLITFWYLDNGRQQCLCTLKNSLQIYFNSTVTYENINIKLLKKEVFLENISFKKDDKVSTIKSCRIKFGVPDLVSQTIIIDEIILENPSWMISKLEEKYSFFPDVISKRKYTGSWRMQVRKTILNNYQVSFKDRTMIPSLPFLLKGKRIIVVADSRKESFMIKGIIQDSFGKDSQLFFKTNIDYSDYMKNFDLQISANNFAFENLNPYQYQHTNLDIDGGIGSFYFNIANSLGVLNGYSYLNIHDLSYSAYKKSIFSAVMGLSNKTFLQMIKGGDNQLELDFLIHGVESNPSIKLGSFSKGLLLKVPGNVVKGSLQIIGKTFNALMLGIPGKVIRSRKMKKAEGNKLIEVLQKS